MYANKKTRDILGYSFDDLRENGLGLVFFVRDENYEFNQILTNAIWNRAVNDYSEVDYFPPDGGKKRLAATTSYLIESNSGKTQFIGFVAIFRDITEVFTLRQKEKKLLEDRERVATEKMRSLNKLAMGVAHEIRNPVVMIGGFAGRIIKLDGNNMEAISYAHKILEGARRLESLVEEVQGCANLANIKAVKGSLAEVAFETVKEMESHASEKSIKLLFHDLSSKSGISRFDPDMMKIAIGNLLQNAIDFSSVGSEVDIFVHENDNETILGVKDYGAGIADAEREFVFDPFFSTKPQGTGMGLAVTERIVHEHGGRIQLDSIPGKGSLFRISIPNNFVTGIYSSLHVDEK
jgi:PAS domain S-box-containing protein